jgi:hypothetical protein
MPICTAKARPRIALLLLSGLAAMTDVRAGDGLPRGWHDAPYLRYEAEAGVWGGGAVMRAALDFDPAQTASEASDRQYVGLPTEAAYVEWTLTRAGDGVTLRFTLPDSAGGAGVAGALQVLVNGIPATTVNLSSYWAWTYFVSSNPQNSPGVRPRMRFDEIHFGLPFPVQSGDVVRVQKAVPDDFEYGVDFIEVEQVPPALTRPTGFVSVADHGANGSDTHPDSAAFDQAWQAARAARTGLYIPPGFYVLTNQWTLANSTNLVVQGAGMWHTELHFSRKAPGAGGIDVGEATERLELSHFFMSSVLNERHIGAAAVSDYKALDGCFGSSSRVHHIWITHFEAGAWLGDYVAPVRVTTHFDFVSNRVRNTFADGLNFAQGTSLSTVRHCSFRDNGDDAMAVWPSNTAGAPEGHHATFHHNTVEFTYRAGGLGLFGGYGHRVHHNLFKDGTDVSGIRFTEDFGGYHFANNTGIYVYENTLVARGTSLDVWNGPRGAIEVAGAGIRNLFFENNEVRDSPRHAIQLQGGTDLFFTNTTITVTGLDRYRGPGGAAIRQYDFGGSATFRHLVMTDIENQPAVIKEVPAYALVIDNQFPVTDRSSLSVPEGGAAGFGVSLSFQPANPVTVSVVRASGDANIQVVSGAEAIFSAVNWSNLQSVMLAAEEDADTSEGSAQILCRAVGWGDTLVTAVEFENDLNHAPVAGDDLAVVDEGSSLTLDVLANDSDGDGQPLSIFAVTASAHGAVTHNGTLASYTPGSGYFGVDDFSYVVTDGQGGFATGRVSVTVREVVTPNPYRMEIRFTGYPATEPLSNFPVLVKFHPSLTNFSYAQFVSSAGHDLRFSNEFGAVLSYEVENWNTAGVSHVWVQVPILTNQARIWASWGSPDNAIPPAYATNGSAWSAGYAGVYHAGEGGRPQRDSSPDGRHGIPFGDASTAPGLLAAAHQFDGTGDYVELPSTFVLFNGRVEVTVEFWFFARAVAAGSDWQTSPVIFQGNGESAWMVTLGDSIPGNALGNRVDQGGWTTTVWHADIETGRWYHCTTTYTPAGINNWKLHLDGRRMAERTRTGAVGHLTEKNAFGGNTVGTDRWFDGLVDEVRVSACARSSNWVWASWFSVVSNAEFVTCGAVDAPAPAPPPDQILLIDFGADASYRGTTVAHPDANGSYWNSVWSGAFYPGLVDVSNQLTALSLAFDQAVGTDSYNGPSNDVDAVALGLLGGATAAVNDYYVSARFQVQGLASNRIYTLRFFGSHKYSDDDRTVYEVYTDSGYTTLVASASLPVQAPGSPWLHNRNAVAVLSGLTAQAGNNLYLSFRGLGGNAGYLNALQMERQANPSAYALWAQQHGGLGGPAADDDGDGLSNLGEFAWGGNPTNGLDAGSSPRLIRGEGTNGLALVYTRAAAAGLSFQVEATTNLQAGPWILPDPPPSRAGGSGYETVTNRLPGSADHLYLRTRLTLP